MSITLDGTNGITQSASFKSNTYLDAAGGNTATVNGTLIPASGVTLVSTAATQTLTNKSIAASQLTGALPAIDGSALTGIVTGGMTLLGTLATTSGTTQTLSGLTLTSYKEVHFSFNNVSTTNAAATNFLIDIHIIMPTVNASSSLFGGGIIDLVTGVIISYSSTNLVKGSSTTITTASTSIGFSMSAGNFDAGTITIYGVK